MPHMDMTGRQMHLPEQCWVNLDLPCEWQPKALTEVWLAKLLENRKKIQLQVATALEVKEIKILHSHGSP